ncbi:unnamed protein product [Ectocarpus sp. 12 AP-2014]
MSNIWQKQRTFRRTLRRSTSRRALFSPCGKMPMRHGGRYCATSKRNLCGEVSEATGSPRKDFRFVTSQLRKHNYMFCSFGGLVAYLALLHHHRPVTGTGQTAAPATIT